MLRVSVLPLLAMLLFGPALAQTQAPDRAPAGTQQGPAAEGERTAGQLEIELNSIGIRNDACEVYLRVRNRTEMGFGAFKVDLAFFDRGGVINDRSLVELGPLRANKTSLHVFQMPEMDCDDIGEVLLNDITECVASTDQTAPKDCLTLVTLANKGDIAFIR